MDRSFRFIVYGIISLLIGGMVHGHAQEDFLLANNAALQGDYDGALSLYDTLDCDGYGVCYNRAYCLYNKQHYVDALFFIKRAERLAKGDQYKAVFDLTDKICKAMDFREPLSGYDRLSRFFLPYVAYIPILVWQLLWVILMIIASIAAVRSRGYVRIIVLLFLSVLIVIVGGMLTIKNKTRMAAVALVVENNIHVYNGPNVHYAALNTIPLGARVTVLDKMDDWVKIYYAQRTGWIPAVGIKEI